MPDNSHALAQKSRLYPVPVVMVFVASLAFYLSSVNSPSNFTAVLFNFILEIGFVFAGTIILKKYPRELSEQHMSLILVSVMLMSFFWEPVCRFFFSSGRTFELMIMFSLKNTLLAMAMACHIRKYQFMMTWGSLFLLIFSVTNHSSPSILLLLAIYLILGLFWMAGNYWNTLKNLLLLSNKENRLTKIYLVPLILVVILVLSFANTSNKIHRVLKGYLPSSGGDGMSDEYANNGTGDGELLVAGKYDISTFAALDNAPFLSSDEPSLYDIFSDTFEEEFNPNKRMDRAISLRTKDSQIEEVELPESENINQNFSTSRDSKKEGDKSAEAIHSEAVLYVAGRTPLHLRMECYDLFDGVDWISEPVDQKNQLSLQVETINDEPWLSLNNLESILTNNVEDELHVLNNLKLKSNVLPSPLHYRKLHVDKLEQADMFGWHQNSIPKMNRDSLPRMVPIHIISRFPDTKKTQVRKTFFKENEVINRHLALPDLPVTAELNKTAQLLTRDANSYSEKIRIIENYHRNKYRQDRSKTFVNNKINPLTQFVQDGNSGPDYLICTSAAIMLRSLGFETRLVSGFYARPDKYDHESKHTPVHKEDAHFWLEVKVSPGYSSWMTVEPTTGYEVLGPEPGLLNKIQYAFIALINSIYQNIFKVLAVLSILILALRNRYMLLDWFVTRWNQFFEPVDIRQFVINTMWITELRLRNQGFIRSKTETFSSWVNNLNDISTENKSQMERLGAYLNWAVYSPDSKSCVDSSRLKEIRLTCRDILVKNK